MIFFTVCLFTVIRQALCGDTVNRTSADSICQTRGNLASFEYVKKMLSDAEFNISDLNISEGQSAWLAGYVNYSTDFVSWKGCFGNISAEKHHESDSGMSIYDCLEGCVGVQNLSHIGIKGNTCYCSNQMELNDEEPMNNTKCGLQNNKYGSFHLKNTNTFLSKSNEKKYTFVSVYKVLNYSYYFWKTGSKPGFFQCVTAKVTNHIVQYGTSSCYASEKEQPGAFVCIARDVDTLNGTGTCTFSDVLKKHHCILYESVNWFKAQQRCMAANGNLINRLNLTVHDKIDTSKKYWTGIIRDFRVIESNSEPEVCLSLKSVRNYIVFEPNDCSEFKRVLCKNDIKKVSERRDGSNNGRDNDNTTANEQLNTSTSTTFVRSSTKGHNCTSDAETWDKAKVVSLSINGLLLVIIVICVIALCKKGQKNVQSLYKTSEKSTATGEGLFPADSISDALNFDRDSASYSSPYQLQFCIMEDSNGASYKYDQVNLRRIPKKESDTSYGNNVYSHANRSVNKLEGSQANLYVNLGQT